MNWQRILKYVFILWAVTFGIAFVFGALTSVLQEEGSAIPVWLRLVQLVAVLAASTAVFATLAYRQSERPLSHALLVLLIASLSALPINVLFFGQTVAQWALSNIFGLITAAAGVGLGVALRKWRTTAASHSTPETNVS